MIWHVRRRQQAPSPTHGQRGRRERADSTMPGAADAAHLARDAVAADDRPRLPRDAHGPYRRPGEDLADLQVVDEELTRLTRVCERLVRSMRVGSDLEIADVDVDAVAAADRRAVVGRRRARLEGRRRRRGPSGAPRERLRACLDTLVENAVRYTAHDDDTVLLYVRPMRDAIAVGVADSGRGFTHRGDCCATAASVADLGRSASCATSCRRPGSASRRACVDDLSQTGLGLGLPGAATSRPDPAAGGSSSASRRAGRCRRRMILPVVPAARRPCPVARPTAGHRPGRPPSRCRPGAPECGASRTPGPGHAAPEGSVPARPPQPHPLAGAQLRGERDGSRGQHGDDGVAAGHGWSARKTTGSPPGGTCTAPGTIPSLGSSRSAYVRLDGSACPPSGFPRGCCARRPSRRSRRRPEVAPVGSGAGHRRRARPRRRERRLRCHLDDGERRRWRPDREHVAATGARGPRRARVSVDREPSTGGTVDAAAHREPRAQAGRRGARGSAPARRRARRVRRAGPADRRRQRGTARR